MKQHHTGQASSQRGRQAAHATEKMQIDKIVLSPLLRVLRVLRGEIAFSVSSLAFRAHRSEFRVLPSPSVRGSLFLTTDLLIRYPSIAMTKGWQ